MIYSPIFAYSLESFTVEAAARKNLDVEAFKSVEESLDGLVIPREQHNLNFWSSDNWKLSLFVHFQFQNILVLEKTLWMIFKHCNEVHFLESFHFFLESH